MYFRAQNPHALIEDQYNKYTALENLCPNFCKCTGNTLQLPRCLFMKGKRGDKNNGRHADNANRSFYAGLMSPKPSDYFAQRLLSDLYSEKVKRKIFLRGIFCADKLAQRFKEHGEDELREVYLIPKEKFPFKNEINIYDDKVAIISHADQIGIIIQNKNIADTQRSVFELGFEYAKILNK